MNVDVKSRLKKLMNKDIILILIILTVAFLAYFLHEILGGGSVGSVTVKVNGVIEGRYSLSEDQEIEINGGTNHLQIRNGKADMTEAACPDKLCVDQKAVSRRGESIICLPNKVIVEVEGGGEREYDAVTN
ncbi:NusG domain II-containing protein [Lachnospiraceae bacterium 48-42]|jgi:Uncharacterized protein conserved in bacteria